MLCFNPPGPSKFSHIFFPFMGKANAPLQSKTSLCYKKVGYLH